MSAKAETVLVTVSLDWLLKTLPKEWGVLKTDGYHVHGSALQRMGEPDIDCSVLWSWGETSHYKLEAKVEGNEPTKLQLYRLEVYKELGYTTGVFTSLDEFKTLIFTGMKQ